MATSVDQKNTASAIIACWSCGALLEGAGHFCASCAKVQPSTEMDHFSFFRLPRKLNIDTGWLEKEFYRLSRKLHPDVYARASADEQSWSLQRSSLLNDAYRALKDPIARTEYLLQLEGVHLEEQSRAATDKARASGEPKQQVVPPDLLEEVFELNMQLEELRMNRTMGEPDENVARDLHAAKGRFEAILSQSTDELKRLWNEWDVAVDAGANTKDPKRVSIRDKMVALLNRRSYLRNLVRDVNEGLS